MADKGRYSYAFQRLGDTRKRENFDTGAGKGKQFIFDIRENYSDFMFIQQFVDQDFVTRHNLFVAGKRLNKERMVWQYYVKSRSVDDYRAMLEGSLYHPPHVVVDPDKSREGKLYLVHRFEGKPLVTEFIANTMTGIEFLWGNAVQLETSEVVEVKQAPPQPFFPGMPPARQETPDEQSISWQRVLYTMKDKKLTKQVLEG
jgi:stage V sporulation protein R